MSTAVGGRAPRSGCEAEKASSGSTVEEGSDGGALASSLSKGASSFRSPGEEDFWTNGSNFGVLSGRRGNKCLIPIKNNSEKTEHLTR